MLLLLLLLELPRSWLTVGVTSLLIHSDSFPTHSCTKRNLLDCRLCPLSTKGKSAGYVSVCVCVLAMHKCVCEPPPLLCGGNGEGVVLCCLWRHKQHFSQLPVACRALSFSFSPTPSLPLSLLLSLGGTSSWVFILFPWFFGLRLQLIFISSTVHLFPAKAQAQPWPDAENSY